MALCSMFHPFSHQGWTEFEFGWDPGSQGGHKGSIQTVAVGEEAGGGSDVGSTSEWQVGLA